MTGRALLLVVSLALALVAAEAGTRWADPNWTIFDPPICWRPDLFQQVPWGYRLWPSRVMPHAYPRENPRQLSLASNADGFRSRRDFHTPDPRPRIVVLGDSMVFGEGVEEPERATELLETTEPAWRVDNLGMIGYGPDLMLRALEEIGLDPPPAAVVFAIYTDDLRRVVPSYSGVGFPIPRYALDDGRLVTVPYRSLRLWERSRFVQGLLYLWWRYTPATFGLNAAILDRFHALATTHGFRPGLVFLPAARDRWDDRERRGWLARYAADHGVPFLDLTDALARAGGERLYIAHDSHWSPEGHRAVAAELRRFLAEEILRSRTTS